MRRGPACPFSSSASAIRGRPATSCFMIFRPKTRFIPTIGWSLRPDLPPTDLKVLLLDADAEYPSEDKSALADFPTQEELNGYDVIILGDVDPKDKRIGDKNLQHLADFVKERGGGLLMIAGLRFSPQAYKD